MVAYWPGLQTPFPGKLGYSLPFVGFTASFAYILWINGFDSGLKNWWLDGFCFFDGSVYWWMDKVVHILVKMVDEWICQWIDALVVGWIFLMDW